VHATLDGIAPGHPRRRQRPARVDRNGVEVEQHAQQHKRQGLVVGVGRNELRHEGQEENRDFGVEHIGPEPAQPDGAQAAGRLGRGQGHQVGGDLGRPGQQQLDADPHQIGRTIHLST
jgi:hypothetical protein